MNGLACTASGAIGTVVVVVLHIKQFAFDVPQAVKPSKAPKLDTTMVQRDAIDPLLCSFKRG